MSIGQTVFGVFALTGLASVGIQVATPEPQSPPPAIEVLSMEHKNGMVEVVRKIRPPSFLADWSVVIVSAEGKAPICVTDPSDIIHHGWSEYEPSDAAFSQMSLDEWVNDPGCYERLKSAPGIYSEYVTWTPRDGRPPATYRGQIVIE